jgi:hypothetical protein
MGTRRRLVGAAALLITIVLAVLWQWPGTDGTDGKTAGDAPQDSSADRPAAYSNVRQEDYVGPQVCGECHAERYAQWESNLHRRMNRLVTEPGAVLGDFEEHRESYAGGEVLFGRRGRDYAMSFVREGAVYRRYRITRTIGSRYMQEYVGVQDLGPEAKGHESYFREIRLPFGFLLSQERWLHQQYFDSWHGAEYDESGAMSASVFDPEQAPWRGRCAWCHNTYAFEKRLARLQGAQQIGSGIELLYTDSVVAPAKEGNLLPVEDLVSVGISCESCHFGGREHAVLGKPIRFEPTGEGIARNSQSPAIAGNRDDARTINAICAQCHSTPTALYPNGAGTRNSSEALDLLSGACASKIKCTDCHDPHVPGPGALAADQDKHIGACIGCHQNLADSQLARSHSRHDSAVTCLDCHMPRIVQGVDELIRSHRISSPIDTEMLATSINACNLCHLDKSVGWTAQTLRDDYGADMPMLAELDLETPAAEAWLASKERIHRLTAASALGYSEHGSRFLDDVVALLDAPVAYDRLRYLWAIEDILGRELRKDEYDVTASPTVRKAQAETLLQNRQTLRELPE